MLEDQVTIPPRSGVIISIGTQKSAKLEGVVEGDKHLLMNREIRIARGIAELCRGKATVMLTNFGNEYKHVSKGTRVAYIEEIAETTNALTPQRFYRTYYDKPSSLTSFRRQSEPYEA